MFHRSTYFASYNSSPEEWEALAMMIERDGQTRLARTIRNGITRQLPRLEYRSSWIGLRFRDGSIQRIEDAIARVQPGVSPAVPAAFLVPIMAGQREQPEIDELEDGSFDLLYRRKNRKLLINVKRDRFTFSGICTDDSPCSTTGSGNTLDGCRWLHSWLGEGR